MTFSLYLLLGVLLFLSSCGNHSHENHDEAEHNHSANLLLTSEQESEFGIEYEIVTLGQFHNIIKTYGEIDASSSDVYKLSAQKNGIIYLSRGIGVGSQVKKGDRIGTISNDGVQGGDLTKAAKANLESAKSEYERLKPLHEDGIVTTSTFREAERAYREAEALAGNSAKEGAVAIISPSDGTIVDLNVKSGEYVEVGASLGVIGKNENMILRADVPVRDSKFLADIETANIIPEGSKDVLKLSDLNGKKISGNSTSNVYNGYLPVYFSFSGSNMLIPGGYTEVYLIGSTRQDIISVPREALLEIQGNKYIYVLDDEHGLEKRVVKTGLSDGERVEITDGLDPGEKIVSKGASIVRMAEVSSVAPPAHTHNH